MYRLIIETIGKKDRAVKRTEFSFEAIDTPAYHEAMEAFSEMLYELDIEFDVIEGDGDMAIDDMLIDAADAEPFEKEFRGRHFIYKIKGSSDNRKSKSGS